MNPNQLKNLILTMVSEIESKLDVLEDKLETLKEETPSMEKVLSMIEVTTPKYGKDWSFSDEEMQEIMNEIRPQEGVDYFIPKDGKDAVITDELIERIAGIVQSRVKQGRDGVNGRDGRDGVDGKDGRDGIDGIDGKDGSNDTPNQVIEKVNLSDLKIDYNRLDVVKLENEIKDLRTNVQMGLQSLPITTSFVNGRRAKNFNFTGGGTITYDGDTANIPVGSGSGGTPANPDTSVQYNTSGAFDGDSNFTRNATTQESIFYKQMTDPNVVTGLQLSEDIAGLGFFPGSAIVSTNSSTGIVSLQGVADLTNVVGFASEGIISGSINSGTGDSLFAVGFFATTPDVGDTGYYYNMAADSTGSGNGISYINLTPTSASVQWTDDVNVVTYCKAKDTEAEMKYNDASSGVEAFVRTDASEVLLKYTPDGTDYYEAKLEDARFFFRQSNITELYLDLDITNDTYEIGDINSATNGNYLQIDNGNEVTTLFAPEFKVMDGAGTYLQIDAPNEQYVLGDVNNDNNGAAVRVFDDATERVTLTSATGTSFRCNGASKYFEFSVSGGGAESYVTGGNLDVLTAPVGIVYTAYDNSQASNGAGANTKLRSGAGSGNGIGGSVVLQTWASAASGSGQQSVLQDVLTLDYRKSAIFIGRIQGAKGANITAANDLTLGFDGNTFTVTGNTTINAIITTGWQSGSEITLIFTGTPTVKHNTSGGAGTAVMLLNGSVDLTAANNTVLCLVYDGTVWQETSRKVA